MLEIHAVSFAYSNEANRTPVIDRWSTTIPSGLTLVHGDTGSGKTTLLRVLAGAEAIAGDLVLAGVRFGADPAGYRRLVCWPDPSDAADDQRITSDVVGAAGLAHAEGFGLSPHLHKPLYMLSTGSRRKAWLAAALASSCALTLLDEPGGALDAPSRAYLMRALAALAAEPRRAIVIASGETLETLPFAATITLP